MICEARRWDSRTTSDVNGIHWVKWYVNEKVRTGTIVPKQCMVGYVVDVRFSLRMRSENKVRQKAEKRNLQRLCSSCFELHSWLPSPGKRIQRPPWEPATYPGFFASKRSGCYDTTINRCNDGISIVKPLFLCSVRLWAYRLEVVVAVAPSHLSENKIKHQAMMPKQKIINSMKSIYCGKCLPTQKKNEMNDHEEMLRRLGLHKTFGSLLDHFW